MMNVYLALKKSVGVILLLFSFVAQSNGNTLFSSDTTGPASISSFTPTSGKQGTIVTIFGSNFTGAYAVRFGGVPADSILFKNDTVIVAIVDTGATGNVSVTTPYGTATKPGFTFIRDTIPDTTAAPKIISFTPTSGRKGAKVLIFGSKFTNASAVRFGGVLADSITFKNDTVIIAIVGSGATGNVSVTTPYGTATKPGFTFIRDTIPDTTAAPKIISFTPTSGRKGAKVLIFGSKFTNASAVRFGGVLADSITFKNDTVIIAIVGSGATGNVSVTTPFGTASKAGFTFIKDTTGTDTTTGPVINTFTPTSGKKGTIVTIIGKRFTGVNQVQFGGVRADSVWIISDSLIKARVDTGRTGAVCALTATRSYCKTGFTFIKDSTSIPDTTTVPVITSFAPTSGRKGTLVTIVGSHFNGATAVRFGGTLADSLFVLSDTVIKAIVDTGSSGNVSVTTPHGTASKSFFTFIRDTTTPAIISFTPTSGTKGTVVTIFGSHFSDVFAVRFGGVLADTLFVLSDSVITAVVDTGATGNVTVFTPYRSATKAGFTYITDTTITDTLFVNTRAGINSNNTLTTAKPFRMYPNPASHYVVWQQQAIDHRSSLQLIDISGRVVRNMVVGSGVSQTTMQVGGLHAGVYKLVWSDGKKKLTHTLLIQ